MNFLTLLKRRFQNLVGISEFAIEHGYPMSYPKKSKITCKSNKFNLTPRALLQHFRRIRRHHIYIRCWIVMSLWEDISKYGFLLEKHQLHEIYSFLLIVQTNPFFATDVPTDSSNGSERQRARNGASESERDFSR